MSAHAAVEPQTPLAGKHHQCPPVNFLQAFETVTNMKNLIPAITLVIITGCAGMHERRDEQILRFIEATEASPLESWNLDVACSQSLTPDHRHQFSITEDTPRYLLPNDVAAMALCFQLPPNANRVNLRTFASGGLSLHSVHTVYPSVMVLNQSGDVVQDVTEPPMMYRTRSSGSGLDGFLSINPRTAHWLVLYFHPENFAEHFQLETSGHSAATTGSGLVLIPYNHAFDIPVSPFGSLDVRISVLPSG